MNTIIDRNVVDHVIDQMGLPNFDKATIREVVAIASKIEAETGIEFVRMEMGVPGLPPAAIGVAAQKAALDKGVAAIYPVIDGESQLKNEASRFIKAFVDISVDPLCCVPVTGSMQGTYASFTTCCQACEGRDTVLFIDPGFPVQKQQLTVMGYKAASFDVYDFRGDLLRDKLEEYLAKGNIAAIVYSNPNNPSWVCLTERELQTIGFLATQYDCIVLEDLAYFAMDFRQNLGVPFSKPFQPTVARYTDNYVLLVSASKAFSYAGERIGFVAISNELYHRKFDGLTARYGSGTFGTVFVHRVLYALSSGVSHSAQYAMAAMLKSANDGEFDFLNEVKEYGLRAKKLKQLFLKHNFHIVYDKDLDQKIGDGFYFTVGYGKMSGGELMRALIYYGITAISLVTTGSKQEGLRACTSFIKSHQFDVIDERLALFAKNNPL